PQLRHHRREDPQTDPHDAKENRRRQSQIRGEWLAETDDDQQRGDDQQHESDVEHGRRDQLNPEKATRTGYRALNAPRARRAREAKRDQDQVFEIPGFPRQETGQNRRAEADRWRFPTKAWSGGTSGRKSGIWVHGSFATRLPPDRS